MPRGSRVRDSTRACTGCIRPSWDRATPQAGPPALCVCSQHRPTPCAPRQQADPGRTPPKTPLMPLGCLRQWRGVNLMTTKKGRKPYHRVRRRHTASGHRGAPAGTRPASCQPPNARAAIRSAHHTPPAARDPQAKAHLPQATPMPLQSTQAPSRAQALNKVTGWTTTRSVPSASSLLRKDLCSQCHCPQ